MGPVVGVLTAIDLAQLSFERVDRRERDESGGSREGRIGE